MSAIFRSIQAYDQDAVWGLLQQFAVSHLPDRGAFESSFDPLVIREDSIFLGVEEDERLVGYLIGHMVPTLFANGPIFEITELIVDESCRGRGFGQGLVTAALAEARDKGCAEAVVPTRRAGPFYERLGFSRSAEYYKIKFVV